MQQKLRRQWLETRIADAATRAARSDAETEGRRDLPPRPGDVYVFTETGDYEMQWAVIDRDPRDASRFMVVPLDSHPLVGSTDIAIPATAPTGASSLRCGFEVWLQQQAFDPQLRTGYLDVEILEQAQRKSAEIVTGSVGGSSSQRETDSELEYQHWAEEILARSQAVLSRLSQAGDAAEDVPSVGQPSWSGEARPEDESWTISDGSPMELLIQIDAGDDADPEDLERLTIQLLAEVRELDVERADLVRGLAAPAGTKSAESVELGALAVMVTPKILTRLLLLLQQWSSRRRQGSVEIRTVSGQLIQTGPLGSLDQSELKELAKQLIEALDDTKDT